MFVYCKYAKIYFGGEVCHMSVEYVCVYEYLCFCVECFERGS